MENQNKTIIVPFKNNERKDKRLCVALIAHDGKKAEMLSFVKENELFFQDYKVISTNSTGELINRHTNLSVRKMLSGPLGGDLQIGGLVASKEVHLVIFLRDPLAKQPHDPDIAALLKVCDIHNIPLATNLSSAEILLKGISENQLSGKFHQYSRKIAQ